MLNQRDVPEAALLDEDAVELARVWIAAKGLHCSLKVGMYRESTKIQEETAWGRILADIARHVANALHEAYAVDREGALGRIAEAFEKELEAPTSNARGSFIWTH